MTPEIVKEAAKEIKDGIRHEEVYPRFKRSILTSLRIGLDWPLDAQGNLPFFGRQAFHKKIIHKAPRIVNDDVWTFNSQSSTQCTATQSFPSASHEY